jgi:hypothetical protein
MYLVVRSYEHTDSRYGDEGFRRVRDELVPLIAKVEGFLSYYSAYDPMRASVTSVSIYETKEAADEANRIAVEWGSEKLGIMGTIHPTAWVGEVLVGAEELPQNK